MQIANSSKNNLPGSLICKKSNFAAAMFGLRWPILVLLFTNSRVIAVRFRKANVGWADRGIRISTLLRALAELKLILANSRCPVPLGPKQTKSGIDRPGRRSLICLLAAFALQQRGTASSSIAGHSVDAFAADCLFIMLAAGHGTRWNWMVKFNWVEWLLKWIFLTLSGCTLRDILEGLLGYFDFWWIKERGIIKILCI